jgi:hypothetical protein
VFKANLISSLDVVFSFIPKEEELYINYIINLNGSMHIADDFKCNILLG